MATITGFIEKIKFRNEENGYTVLSSFSFSIVLLIFFFLKINGFADQRNVFLRE